MFLNGAEILPPGILSIISLTLGDHLLTEPKSLRLIELELAILLRSASAFALLPASAVLMAAFTPLTRLEPFPPIIIGFATKSPT